MLRSVRFALLFGNSKPRLEGAGGMTYEKSLYWRA